MEVLKINDGEMSRGNRIQLEGAPAGQVWDNLSIRLIFTELTELNMMHAINK